MSREIERPQQPSEHQSIGFCVLWIVAVLAVLSLARLLTPAGESGLVMPGLGVALPELCTFRRFFAADCPGCGLTRSFVLAVRFRIADAWAMHPVGTLLVFYLVGSIAPRLVRLRSLLAARPQRQAIPWEPVLGVTLVAAAYLRWALRWIATMA
jgi:hypothetical protein